jgi:hypothetical protein
MILLMQHLEDMEQKLILLLILQIIQNIHQMKQLLELVILTQKDTHLQYLDHEIQIKIRFKEHVTDKTNLNGPR